MNPTEIMDEEFQKRLRALFKEFIAFAYINEKVMPEDIKTALMEAITRGIFSKHDAFELFMQWAKATATNSKFDISYYVAQEFFISHYDPTLSHWENSSKLTTFLLEK